MIEPKCPSSWGSAKFVCRQYRKWVTPDRLAGSRHRATTPWAEIHGLSHSSSRQRLLFHKIKGQRLSGWDVKHARRGCPHCPSSGPSGGEVFHIVWTCPSAQRLWRTVRSWWASLGIWTMQDSATDREFLTAVFSLRLPRTPSKVWDMASLSQRLHEPDAPEGPYPALQAAWQQLVLETLVVIFGWRRSCFDQERAWSPTQAAVIHDVSCQKILDMLALRCSVDPRVPPGHTRLLRELKATFEALNPHDWQPSVSLVLDVIHLLFFDGGSRGNPGPGGSGTCILRVDVHVGAVKVLWPDRRRRGRET